MDDITDTLLALAAKRLKGFEKDGRFLPSAAMIFVTKVHEKLKRGSVGAGKP